MNTFGRLFRITTFGESHGAGIGVVIDGLPGGLAIDWTRVQKALARRRPGHSPYTSSRQEPDTVEVLSGLYQGKTTGAPLALWIPNQDARSEDYAKVAEVFRPSHADFTYVLKYKNPDPRGGGRSSARETAARVAAGAIASQLLESLYPELRILAWTSAIGPYETSYQPQSVEEVESSPVRCPDPAVSQAIIEYLELLRGEGDTTGGIISARVEGLPAGLGEPLYDKLHARLAYAMLSINAAKGFEIGTGFAGARMRGSEHNDPFIRTAEGEIRPETNRAGGVLGGISTGAPLFFRVAFKPIATLRRPQKTVTRHGEPTLLVVEGRHDPCPVPRAVPIVEAMTAIVLADFVLLHRASAI
ncbi:MAG: chorismate synthase [Bacteroidia bacterium]|nr:chorismate synthase [Bacteroidia bacterium]MCX7763772.1 chorismate synthase [Bacteroidia bacterium]MDW8058033.1 chorismate synthase [Bacteroidia bacterium]